MGPGWWERVAVLHQLLPAPSLEPYKARCRAAHMRGIDWKIDNSVIVLHPCWHAPARVTFIGHA